MLSHKLELQKLNCPLVFSKLKLVGFEEFCKSKRKLYKGEIRRTFLKKNTKNSKCHGENISRNVIRNFQRHACKQMGP